MITLKEAKTRREIKRFVLFPFSLYRRNKYWVPPIIKDEIDNFNPKKNPVFKNADARFFLAYKDRKVVGRVIAIINWFEVNEQKIRKMRFGWFDTIDDVEVMITLPADMNMVLGSLPFTDLGNNQFLFSIGTVASADCGSFIILAGLDCNVPLGATRCVEASIVPNSCLDEFNWNGSTLRVTGECDDSENLVRFKIGNEIVTKRILVNHK